MVFIKRFGDPPIPRKHRCCGIYSLNPGNYMFDFTAPIFVRIIEIDGEAVDSIGSRPSGIWYDCWFAYYAESRGG